MSVFTLIVENETQKMKQFNTSDTLLVLTSYPNPENEKLGKRSLNAVGWHSERLLKNIGEKRRILVLAEEDGENKEFMASPNVLVKRVWKKGDLLSFFKLAKAIKRQDNIKTVLIQFEFNVFGGTLPNLYLLFLMLYIRLLGKRITFECHQVILNIKLLQKHINIKNPFLQVFYNVSLRFYYMLLGFLANNIIVFEVELKNRLSRYVWGNKIYALSLAVEKKKTIEKNKAREIANKNLVFKNHKIKNDEFVLLVFGFINGYKGIDWIIEQLKNSGKKKLRLLVVGGKNPYLINKPSYQTFYKSIIDGFRKYAHMSYVDFVPEKDIHIYFSASDAVVIPYEVFMSASGPFSHALSYGKPVLLSEHLRQYTESQDIKYAVNQAEITIKDFIFAYNKRDFMRVVNQLRDNQAMSQKLTTFSKTLARLRGMQKIATRLDNILFPTLFVPREQKFKAKFTVAVVK